jgi:Uma2 family endonuclease
MDKPESEFLAGREVPKVSPRRSHGVVQFAFARILYSLGHAYGTTATEWRFPIMESPHTSLMPDVAFVARERLTALSSEEREAPAFAPDVAVEIRSPSDRVADVEWKMDAYVRERKGA